ncbi:hypothetical protein Taro_000357 [Colocasia esculenta]|uniref:Uncharacterized protein n=1 Tax=Colocasia esculenta TaxID=4460 RepID=A0A843T7K3_COLES|nr:hypothetical protein [Colocasia esculenta]
MTEAKPEEKWARSNRDLYSKFRHAQAARKIHIKRMAPTMGPSYQIELGAVQAYFEEQERHTFPVIRHFASLLSPTYYLHVPPQN